MLPKTTAHSLLVCLCGLLITAPLYAQTTVGGRLRAGAAKVDITPGPKDLKFPTDVIRDHVFARAIMVDNGNTCAVLIGFELSNATEDQDVVDGISSAAQATGCPAENFIVSYSHTHSSSTQGLQVGPPSSKQQQDIMVTLATAAKAKLAPARIGYGSTTLDLNKSDSPSLTADARASSKALAVVEFIGADGVPIGVYMNYAMHPTDFYQTGVLSADFPGEASKYLENLFGGNAVAIFSQGASGDQSPAFAEPAITRLFKGQGLVEKFGAPAQPRAARASTPAQLPAMSGTPAGRDPPPGNLNVADYHRAIELTGANVTMMGTMVAASTVKVMRDIKPVETAQISGFREIITCPGRDRDADKPVRANGMPEYKDAEDVNIRLGVLRIGDIHFAAVTGELYSEIAAQIKSGSPDPQTMVVTLANGRNKSGYIYADDAVDQPSFSVLTSRLKPGCAQGKIVSTTIGMIRASDKQN